MRLPLALVTTAVVALTALQIAAQSGARELEGRLIAPCCWTQTLDTHDSPLADELRREIVRRLGLGEASSSIEDDLVRRYGEKILAVPRGQDPRLALPIVLVGLMVGGALLLFWFGLRWRRTAAVETQTASEEANSDYDTKLEAELRREGE